MLIHKFLSNFKIKAAIIDIELKYLSFQAKYQKFD